MIEKKKIINYPVNYYPCQVIINSQRFTKLEISQYYQTKLGRSTVTDEIIRELVRQLDDKEVRKISNYYNYEPLYIDYRAYNLIWDYDELPFSTNLIIIDCYRERKYDKN